MKSSFPNLFIKWLTLDRVVPIISPRVSWLIFGITLSGLWEVSRGQMLTSFSVGGDVARSVAFSPDKKWLAAACSKGGAGFKGGAGQVRIWELASGRLAHTLEGHSGGVLTVAFSPDGSLVATAGEDNAVRIWDAASGQLKHLLTGHGGRFGWVHCVAFSPNGRLIASAGEDHTVKLWSPSDASLVRSLEGHSDRIESLAFSPDGKTLATGGLGLAGNVALWDIPSGGLVRSLRPPLREAPVRAPEDETEKAVGNLTEMFKKLDMLDWQITSVQTEWKGRRDSSGSLQQIMAGLEGTLRPVAFSPDGHLLLTGSLDRFIYMWDARDGSLRRTLTAHSGLVRAIALSPDGTRFASAGEDKNIKVWNASNGYQLGRIDGAHSGPIRALIFSPDGKSLASSASGDRATKLWNTSGWALVRTIDSGGSDSLAFSPDGRWLYTASSDVQVWDIATGRLVRTLGEKSLSLTSLALSPDGRLLAGGTSGEGSAHMAVLLWDTASGALQQTLLGHSGPVWAVAFSADGRIVASASDDTTLKFWETGSGTLLATAFGIGQGDDWLVTTPDGLFDGSPGGWGQVRWRFSEELFDTAPIEMFFNEFYHPGLLAEILVGRRPKAPRDIAQLDRRQPEIKLALAGGPQTGAISTRNISLKLEVAEAPANSQRPTGSGARDVRLFRNGSLIRVWHGDVLAGKGGQVTLEATLPIVAGVNRLTAYAFNRDNIKSSDAELVITGSESLKRQGTVHILAIGINEYQNRDYKLNYAVADANAFAEGLRQQQSRLGRLTGVEFVTLQDQDASKANILGAIARLAGQTTGPLSPRAPQALGRIRPAEPEDTVYIYYAGHGTAAGPRFYLIPNDLGYRGPRTELDEIGLKTILEHSISDQELEQGFEKVDASHIVLVIDACNSGQALEAEEKRRGPMNSKGLAQLAYEKGMYILTAAQGYQAALEAAQLGHGYLTYALVQEGLGTPVADASPKDGQVTVREWLDYATLRVPRMQEMMMQDARKLGREIAFVEGEEATKELAKRSLQRPRVFYRRELKSEPLIVAKFEAKP